MKFIKHQNKYYKIEKEVSLEEINEYKVTLQAHIDTLEARRQAWIKQEKEKVELAKENASLELQELNNLT